MPEIQVGDIRVKMSVDEFIEFIKKTDATEIASKLQAMAKQKETPPSP